MYSESENRIFDPYFVKSRDPDYPPASIKSESSKNPLPTYANVSTELLTKERNLEIQKEYTHHNLQFFYPLKSYYEDNDINAALAIEINGQKLRNRGHTSLISRISKVTDVTVRKITESLESSIALQAQFDYWAFQGSLLQRQIFDERLWLESQIWKSSEQAIRWMPPPPVDSSNSKALLKEFEKLYGPINEKDNMNKMLLCTFRTSLLEYTKKFNKKLRTIWGISQAMGPDVALQLIRSRMQDQLESLKLSQGHSGFALMQQRENNDVGNIYNINPVTNFMHSEWFLLSRFRGQSGPSSLFIKYPRLESTLAEYQAPPGVTFVEGYWSSLIDLTFTHPVRWCDDPLKIIEEQGVVEEENENEENNKTANDDGKEQDIREILLKVLEKENNVKQLERERQFRVGFYNRLHDSLRKLIKRFPMGISINVYFDKFLGQHYRKESSFPGLSYAQVVHDLHDVFLTSSLPDTDDLILFPAFMKWILPEDDGMPALTIFKRVWNKIIFTVKTSGGKIRCQDLHPLYWKYWSLKIQPLIDEWGFPKIESFIEWSMRHWNTDGKGEGLIIQPSTGTASPLSDPFLVYKPADN